VKWEKSRKFDKTQVDPMVLIESDLDEIGAKVRDIMIEVL